MNYQTLSPSDCAAEILGEITKEIRDNPALKIRIENLVRQQIRNVYEHCARVAEDYVAMNDRAECMSGMQVGDLIAEELRQLAEERRNSVRLAHTV